MSKSEAKYSASSDTSRTNPETEGFIKINNEQFYCIKDIDKMPPFLMSVTSSDDHWMFLSSLGGLTAGRRNESYSLFPYETEDKIHKSHTHTGSVIVFRIYNDDGSTDYWQPFKSSHDNDAISRNLYKNILGNSVIFEEINHELGLSYRNQWSNSEKYGFIKTSTVKNLIPVSNRKVDILDGLKNVLPSGVEVFTQLTMSNLADAYKRSEIDPQTKMGIFSLSSLLMDRPEPGESLNAAIIWAIGLSEFDISLSETAIRQFLEGREFKPTTLVTGLRGCYLLHSTLEFRGDEALSWSIVADVNQNQQEVALIRKQLREERNLAELIKRNIQSSTNNLLKNVAAADGFQKTSSNMDDSHHLANVMFNIMRGGVFAANYTIEISDFKQFLNIRNKHVLNHFSEFLNALPKTIELADFLETVVKMDDPDLQRLLYEYLPIMFSRRHGDPSRPWNKFDIRIKDNNHNKVLNYQGNWRDIFQNWEALSISYPTFLESFIAKFVNASTIDGFNPYRITRDGIDWEISDPDDPWSFIGYWGDHQIIYLLKFLELSNSFHPQTFRLLLEKSIYSYANVPYQILPYEKVVENPKSTIDFNHEKESVIEKLVEKFGMDGKLLLDNQETVYHVSLIEKLFVPLLSKISNLIPDGGIWMNTQRPEWNDANNALVGNGISMVTHYYLRRFLQFLHDLFLDHESDNFTFSTEIAEWFEDILDILLSNKSSLSNDQINDSERRKIVDALGTAFSKYRSLVYDSGFSGKRNLSKSQLLDFIHITLSYIDHGNRANKRSDGLYNAYNLLDIKTNDGKASILELYQMLEGQVAVLTSGTLTGDEVISVLDELFNSDMFCAKRNSFLLYPSRELPGFMEKNIIPDKLIMENTLLSELLDDGNGSIIFRDVDGHIRFNCAFRNSTDLQIALNKLVNIDKWKDFASDTNGVEAIFEEVFNHHAFTGRSGCMYAYEGIGSIYWHMVSKLLLVVQEYCLKSKSTTQQHEIGCYYYRIRQGLGFNKTAREYGAFPFDPYSHTPGHLGAQQPGMTGQVKEEILTRFGELGIIVHEGILHFQPSLLRKKEFLSERTHWTTIDVNGRETSRTLGVETLGFTYCQIPIVYDISKPEAQVQVEFTDGSKEIHQGSSLNLELSSLIFNRNNIIKSIYVHIPKSRLAF
jgi:hypothetical protein